MSAFPGVYNIPRVYAGDSYSHGLVYKEGETAAAAVGVSLSGATISAAIAASAGASAVTTFDVTLADQGTNPGEFTLALTPVKSALLTASSYVYDVQITWADASVQTIVKGTVSVTQDVT